MRPLLGNWYTHLKGRVSGHSKIIMLPLPISVTYVTVDICIIPLKYLISSGDNTGGKHGEELSLDSRTVY